MTFKSERKCQLLRYLIAVAECDGLLSRVDATQAIR